MIAKQFIVIFGITFYFATGMCLYLWPDIFRQSGGLVLIVSVAFLIGFVKYMQFDFIIQLRLIFLMTIGISAAIAKLISPDMVLIDFGRGIQSYDTMIIMYALSMIAAASSMIGYIAARNIYKPILKTSLGELKISKDYSLYVTSLVLIIVIGFLSGRSYGPPVWDAVYASGEGEGQFLGNLQSIGVILIGINYLIAYRINKRKTWILSSFAYFYLLVIGILIRGGRLEFLSGILAIYICISVVAGAPVGMRLRNYLWLILAAVFMEYIGYLRYALAGVDAETFTAGFLRMYDNGILFLGTISGIGSAFANVIDMLQNRIIDYSYGFHYLEYFLRTPPEFLYPGRPEDLSSIFEKYGYISIGGFFEIAEEYLNFGLLGVVFIPGLITYFFKRVSDKAVSGSFFSYILLLAIVSVFMRGAWYQTFAYYKAIVTGLIIYFLISIYRSSTRKSRRSKNKCVESLAQLS